MAIKIGDALLHLGVDSSELDRDMKKSVDNIKSQMRAVGATLTGFGVAITGALTMAVKSAAQEEAGIIKLTQALKNAGVAYDAVKDSLEATINATQQKTSVADDKQREALAGLVALTNDYNRALQLLPITLDLAAAKGMDLVAASDVIGRVAEGNTTILTRYGIQLKEGATATEALAELQQKYGGQAEAYGQSVAGQFELIKNNISDVMESIGTTVLPVVRDLFQNYINPLVLSLKAWADSHPGLVKQLVILAGVVGGLAAVLGPILIMLPTLAAGFQLLLGPIGWISLAITALVAAGTALYLNWDKVWSWIKRITLNAIDGILAGLQFLLGWIPGLNEAFTEAREKLNNLISAEEAHTEALTQEGAAIDATTEKQYAQNNALREAINLQEEFYKAAKKTVSGTLAAFGSYEEREAYAREAAEWERKASSAAAAGRTEEASFAAMEAAAMQTRLQQATGGLLQGFANGGMITEPTLLTRLSDMRPYAIAGEKGPEPVGFPSVNISGNNFYVREEADIDRIGEALVKKIYARTGVRI